MLKHSNEEVNIQSETKSSKIIDANFPNPKPVRADDCPSLNSVLPKNDIFSSHGCQILAHKELSDW